MAEQDRYQIAADCAYITVETVTGTAVALGYRGQFVSADDPKLQHLLDSKMVVKVGDASSGVNAEGTLGPAEASTVGPKSVVSVTPPTPEQLKAEADKAAADAKRETVKAKLPADGSPPHANAGEDVWVEFAVSKGLDRAEAQKAGKAEIIKALGAR